VVDEEDSVQRGFRIELELELAIEIGSPEAVEDEHEDEDDCPEGTRFRT
jgi:hypothetical protein